MLLGTRANDGSAYRLLRPTPSQGVDPITIIKAPDRRGTRHNPGRKAAGLATQVSDDELQAALGEVGQIQSKDVIDSDK